MADDEKLEKEEEEEVLVNRAGREAVVESEGLVFSGSNLRGEVGVGLEVELVDVHGDAVQKREEISICEDNEVICEQGGGDEFQHESEFVNEEGDGERSGVGGGDTFDSVVKLETVAVSEDDGENEAMKDKGVFEKDLAECGDMQRVDEEDGEDNVSGKSELCGVFVEDCLIKDVVEEKGEGIGKNVALEECAIVNACGDMELIDIDQSGENKKEMVGESVFICTDVVDCQMSGAVEEKEEEFENNLTAEHGVIMTTVGATDQMDESSMNKEDVGDENVAGTSVLASEDSHMECVVEENREDLEKNLVVEHCAVMTAIGDADQKKESKSTLIDDEFVVENVVIGDADQINESKNTLKEEGVVDENVTGNSFVTGMVVEDSHMTDVVKGKGEEVENNLVPKQCPVMACIDNKEKEDEVGEKNVTGDTEMIGVEFTADHITESNNVEDVGGDGDQETGTEEVNNDNKKTLEEHNSTAPDINFSLHTVELDPMNVDVEMATEEVNNDDKKTLEEDCLAAPDIQFSLHTVELDPLNGEDDEAFADREEPLIPDAEVETQIDTPDTEKVNSKPKRDRKPSKIALAKQPEEDVCFICFDGGDLVVCDRRGCPKVYHPSCVNHDEAFFKAKGRWNCGWHLCSKCEKNAQYMCLTCTFSLCKGCIKDTDFYSVRASKGFCKTCFKTVNLVESKEQANNEEKLKFDDKTCWECLFKDYWIDMKEKLQLTSEELSQAKNPLKGYDAVTNKQKSADEANTVKSGSNNSSGNVMAVTSKKIENKRKSKAVAKGEDSPSGSDISGDDNKSKRRKTKKQATPLRKRGLSGKNGNTGSKWASSELLKFVMHMRQGDASVLTQFEVQELLLEYIKTNKLRDPRRKSQIICDAMFKGLFRKPRVGHFEMLKLLESHFLMKEELHGSSVDDGASPSDELSKSDASAKKDKKRKMCKKGFGQGTQSNNADYAAIDVHNISLVFLRRNLIEVLLECVDNFQDKVVGGFVRIRITGSNQIQDMYRLVRIVGTSKAPIPYRVEKQITDINLEIQNLNKQEVVSIDIISNQEFTEDECSRLRQSIKCGLIPRLTVGDIFEKAMDLQAARVSDWLETEMVRLRHLCDRASDMGKRKELRVNVEKLQNLKKPEERQRRLEDMPEVHSDPKMDPSYESDEDEEEADGRKQENFLRLMGSGFNQKGNDSISPRKGGSTATDSGSRTRGYSGTIQEIGRSLSSKGFSGTGEDDNCSVEITRAYGGRNENELLSIRERQKVATVASESVSGIVSDSHQTNISLASSPTLNETEKMWHYKDPSGKIQGPFSIVQLRKWNSTGFFPKDLTIWRTNDDQDDGVLLLDALAGMFLKESGLNDNLSNKVYYVQGGLSTLPHTGRNAADGITAKSPSPSQVSLVGRTRLSADVSMSSAGAKSSSYDSRNDFTNLPSPTPHQVMGSTSGEASMNRLSSVGRSVPGSLTTDSSQIHRSSTTLPGNHYQTAYSQQIGSTGYHQQQPAQSATSINDGVESRVSVSVSPSMMQSIDPQPSRPNASSNQIPLAASNAYSQWSNPAAASTEKPCGSFPIQGLAGTPAATLWRPPTVPLNQPGMQPMTFPDQSWRPVTGNPNMGWGVVQETPTGQVAPQMNTNWAVQGMALAIGNATAGWIPSGNSMPGYVGQVNSQAGGIMNPGWFGQTTQNTNTNLSWADDGQGSLQNPKGQNVNERYSNSRQQGGEGGGSYHQRGGGGPTRVCEYYLSNRCRKGSACRWLHPQRQ